jgi:DNA topoisomerase-3
MAGWRVAGGFFLDDASIFRAHFSALTQPALRAAYAKPRRPNAAEAMAVDARQELDLKIGCSFTRFLTRQLLEGAKVRSCSLVCP